MKLFVLIFVAFAACVTSINVETLTEIVLFDEINLENVQGVSAITGFDGYPAYNFLGNTPALIVNQSTTEFFAEKTKKANVFIVSTYIRTNRTILRPVMSLSAGPLKPKDTTTAFDVKFSWKTGYKAVTGQVSFLDNSGDVREFSQDINVGSLQPDQWIHFSVIIHKDEQLVRFRINNQFFSYKSITGGIQQIPSDGVMRVAQELVKGDEDVKKINRFTGDLQNLTITFEDCLEVPILYPTQPPITEVTTEPTACPTTDTCKGQDGSEYENGGQWSENVCTTCVCESGKTRCVQFCKLCKSNGKFYVDGTSWHDSDCKKCECKNGEVSCVNTIMVKKTNGCNRTCSDSQSTDCPHKVYNGCFCPDDKVFINGKCLDRLSCPCNVNGNVMQPGDYNLDILANIFCICSGGEYSCENL